MKFSKSLILPTIGLSLILVLPHCLAEAEINSSLPPDQKKICDELRDEFMKDKNSLKNQKQEWADKKAKLQTANFLEILESLRKATEEKTMFDGLADKSSHSGYNSYITAGKTPDEAKLAVTADLGKKIEDLQKDAIEKSGDFKNLISSLTSIPESISQLETTLVTKELKIVEKDCSAQLDEIKDSLNVDIQNVLKTKDQKISKIQDELKEAKAKNDKEANQQQNNQTTPNNCTESTQLDANYTKKITDLETTIHTLNDKLCKYKSTPDICNQLIELNQTQAQQIADLEAKDLKASQALLKATIKNSDELTDCKKNITNLETVVQSINGNLLRYQNISPEKCKELNILNELNSQRIAALDEENKNLKATIQTLPKISPETTKELIDCKNSNSELKNQIQTLNGSLTKYNIAPEKCQELNALNSYQTLKIEGLEADIRKLTSTGQSETKVPTENSNELIDCKNSNSELKTQIQILNGSLTKYNVAPEKCQELNALNSYQTLKIEGLEADIRKLASNGQPETKVSTENSNELIACRTNVESLKTTVKNLNVNLLKYKNISPEKCHELDALNVYQSQTISALEAENKNLLAAQASWQNTQNTLGNKNTVIVLNETCSQNTADLELKLQSLRAMLEAEKQERLKCSNQDFLINAYESDILNLKKNITNLIKLNQDCGNSVGINLINGDTFTSNGQTFINLQACNDKFIGLQLQSQSQRATCLKEKSRIEIMLSTHLAVDGSKSKDGYTHVPPKWLKVYTKPKTLAEARLRCQGEGGNLAAIDSTLEESFVNWVLSGGNNDFKSNNKFEAWFEVYKSPADQKYNQAVLNQNGVNMCLSLISQFNATQKAVTTAPSYQYCDLKLPYICERDRQ